MEYLKPWNLIKAGFWIGIGFIIPSIGVYLLATILVYAMPGLWQSLTMDYAAESSAQILQDYDRSKDIKVTTFRESNNKGQLLILGTIENTGDSVVSSIQLEAELLDKNEQMIYECSEYISKRLQKGETENFQIKCGCDNRPIPEYVSLTVRVVSASNY